MRLYGILFVRGIGYEPSKLHLDRPFHHDGLVACSSGCVRAEPDEGVGRENAAPLVEKRGVDGLSVGYIEGDNYGIVHLGSASPAGRRANNLTLYEIGSVSKMFTALLLADSMARGEIESECRGQRHQSGRIRLPAAQWTLD